MIDKTKYITLSLRNCSRVNW